ncbi:nitroimidazol reductase NimA-like FMN-containing flavoprotein (pyridoxamine 5'-phosphate oxidase superfamily) [Dysgonomonas sp. PH5-45]|uniref:pyridoxamine 5'-phosphate oxidase family protein n=1 Tax=unclassified Dysgonomonas TaxID=2630389 RepID=UPI002473F14B|nr:MULTISPECIES: pyridoxamine 5'-phosphate oxidase family protein [unclassified Dysgonomonas]MDH6355628.1 nitroimidazol reductase NimA-like FMN-containing flavoprotein (pyridoxamine 5'-phosphate oxidase superfamily) [Dysgonomonas sp. PH5-45]MDH6388525.1 nitroimidazol reductase NimA-like FMN-containing flavoprotein (pyridoxamine 5'-phosphate oxidase superfamily) [Dysgonomonas sp. PH5-37]
MRRKDREVTTKEEIVEIFSKADACRIAFSVDNVPYIVCLNYGYEWEGETPVLYFHCAHEGKKLEQMARNNYVCFQLDTEHELYHREDIVYCTMNYASVVGMGYLKTVEDEAERIKGLNLLMMHHGHRAPVEYPEGSMRRTTVLRLDVTEYTAKRKEQKKDG